MKTGNKKQFWKILFLGAALMACNFVTAVKPTVTPAATPTPSKTKAPTATPTIRVTLTPFYKVNVGSKITIASGGFSFLQVKGYKTLWENNTGAFLSSSDKKVEVGMFAYPRSGGRTISGIMDDWAEAIGDDFDSVTLGDPVEETKDDVASIFVEFTGMDDKVPLQGRLTLYESPNSKILYLYVAAYGDQRWQREGRSVLEFTSASIGRFDITARDDCPAPKRSDYGLVATSPIKIGGGGEDGQGRIYNYLAALLGSRGELVSYGLLKPVTQAGVELGTYRLRIGNTYKILYFDTVNYEELKVPLGLTCSAPLPGKPQKGYDT